MNIDFHKFYSDVYKQDFPDDSPHGWIQWKGTDVCIDLHCDCGHHGHIDTDFFYFYECANCKKLYAVGSNVKLIELNEEQKQFILHDRPTLIKKEENDE